MEYVRKDNHFTELGREILISCLEEMSDKAFQRRAWNGEISGEMHIFEEAVIGIFTDSGMWHLRKDNKTGFDDDILEMFDNLHRQLMKIDEYRTPNEIIDDPKMVMVRKIAGDILKKIR